MSKNNPSKSKVQKPKPTSVGLFDLLNQALAEFIHAEHIQPPSYQKTVEQCISNKKQNPNSIDPIIFAFSPVADPPDGLFVKYVELLRSRYIRNLAQIFVSKSSDFVRFHRFMSKQAVIKPELFDFLSQLALTSAESEPQNIATLFMKSAFQLYSPFLNDKDLLPHVVKLIFSHTESDETSRDSRVPQILSCISDEETQYTVLAHTVMQENIFSTRLCDLYASYVDNGLKEIQYQPFAVHILRYLASIRADILQSYLPRITELVNDNRLIMQTALVQLLVDATQEGLLMSIIESTDRLEVLSLALHLVSELGAIPGQLLIMLFKKIGSENVESVCTERCVVESPVGQIQLGRLTNAWNSAAINAAVIAHIQTVPLQNWDVEFSLSKLLLKQPMDSTSSGIWKQLFTDLAPQFGDLMKDEEMTESVFDIVCFYLIATLDIDLFERLIPSLEPVLAISKEKCKSAATRFLTRVSELNPKFKQIVSTLIPI